MTATSMPDVPSTLCGAHTVTEAEAGAPFDVAAWYTPPQLSTLFGTAIWDELDDPARARVCRHEAALLASSAIHGEDQVLGGLRPRAVDGSYLAVFAAEEENHQQMFTAYLAHLRLGLVPARATAWQPREISDVELFVAAMLFEDVISRRNRRISRAAGVHPVAVAVNRSHAIEEAQHLRYDRMMLAELLPAATDEVYAGLARFAGAYLRAVLREQYRSDVYAAAGLDGWRTAKQAWAAPAQVAARTEAATHALRHLPLGLDPEEIAR